MASKIKKGDKVIVLTGKDKGKTGEVLKIITKTNRALVRGINIVKKHQKATQQAPGGIVEKEAAIHISNLAMVDPTTGGATKVGFKTLDDGKKVRYAKKSGTVLDN